MIPMTSIKLSEHTFPPFLRLNSLKLLYLNSASIQEKCEFIESQLLLLKPILNDSNMIEFHAIIDENDCRHEHSKLLEYIRNRLLSICNLSRGYKFHIKFFSDKNSAARSNTIASLLQMDEIKRCSNIEIEFPTV